MMTAPRGGTTLVGNLLSVRAVGCLVCNKVVVLVLCASGAMTWFAPTQPLLAAGSLALLGDVLHARWRARVACPVPAWIAGGLTR